MSRPLRKSSQHSPIPIHSTIYVHHGLNSTNKPHKATVLRFHPPNDLFVQFYNPIPTKNGLVTQDYVKIWRIVAKGSLEKRFGGSNGEAMGRYQNNNKRTSSAFLTAERASAKNLVSHAQNTQSTPSPTRKRTSPHRVHFASTSTSQQVLNDQKFLSPKTPIKSESYSFSSPLGSSQKTRKRSDSHSLSNLNATQGASPVLQVNNPFEKGEKMPHFCVGVALSLDRVTATLMRPNGSIQVIDLTDMNLQPSVQDFLFENMDTDQIQFVPHVEMIKKKKNTKRNSHKIAMLLSGNTESYWQSELTKQRNGEVGRLVRDHFTPRSLIPKVDPQSRKRRKFLNIHTGSPKRNYSLKRLSQFKTFSSSDQSAFPKTSPERKSPKEYKFSFQDYIISVKRRIEYLIGKTITRLVVSIPMDVEVCGSSPFPPQDIFMSHRRKLQEEGVSVSVIHHGCSAIVSYGIKEKCTALMFDGGRDVLRTSLLQCHRGKITPLYSKKVWIGGNDFVDRLFSLVLTQLRKEFNFLPLYDDEVHYRIRTHCKRAVQSLLEYSRTTIEIQELTTDIPVFRMAISKEDLVLQCEDIFHQLDTLLESEEQDISKQFNLAFSNVDCVILVGESIGHFVDRIRFRFSEKKLLYDHQQCRLSRGASLFGLQHTQQEILKMIEQSSETKHRFHRASRVARNVNTFLDLKMTKVPRSMNDAKRAYSPVDLNDLDR
mmetsp:Transcript_5639/g.21228  ORF Transcript_5639/g.21228 Transcript_5639/m.21228 type:complete len:712 (-) Transcript_5639:1487-3622(-)